MSPELSLGTVQFGLPYGVTNTTGQIPENEVRSILKTAFESGITLLDTAQCYGTAESVLGACCTSKETFRVISKLPSNSPENLWETYFQNSLKLLRTSRLHGYLLHDANDLRKPNGNALIEWLNSLRERELVDRIGVSIYSSEDLKDLPLEYIQLVQLPLSIYDQRLLQDGTVSYLNSLGISVHARSLFLQGLLLKSSTFWPKFISSEFRIHHAKFEAHLAKQGLSLLDGSLAFARSCKLLEAVLIGVLSLRELNEIIESWKSSNICGFGSFDLWSWNNTQEINPGLWPKV